MMEREVVFGGEQKLRDEIDGSLEIIDADAYFVLTGCTAGIIGDDVAAITSGYRKNGFPVYPIETPGFAGDTLLGYETAFDSFIEYIVEPQPRQSNLVNLLGIVPQHDPYWFGTLEELTRILNKLGLEVNSFFTQQQGIEAVKRSGAAALNIIASPWLLKGAAEKYEEKFGVPSIRFNGAPYGATQTAEFVRGVCKALSLGEALAEKVVNEENVYVYSLFETIIGALSWKKFVVAADAATAISITRFLADDFSFTPVAAIVTEPIWRPSDKERITNALSQLEYAKPPKISFLVDHYDIRQEIKKHDFTLLIGSSLEDEVARELDVQLNRLAFPISDQLIINRTYAGYRGCLTLVEDLFNNL
jgi:nitrogenase molybdenum-iron protein beta chain